MFEEHKSVFELVQKPLISLNDFIIKEAMLLRGVLLNSHVPFVTFVVQIAFFFLCSVVTETITKNYLCKKFLSLLR